MATNEVKYEPICQAIKRNSGTTVTVAQCQRRLNYLDIKCTGLFADARRQNFKLITENGAAAGALTPEAEEWMQVCVHGKVMRHVPHCA